MILPCIYITGIILFSLFGVLYSYYCYGANKEMWGLGRLYDPFEAFMSSVVWVVLACIWPVVIPVSALAIPAYMAYSKGKQSTYRIEK